MTCDELSPIEIMRKNMAAYLAIVASDAEAVGDDDLAALLYEASVAYQVARYG